ncbi:MAG: GGDEF domain-containing protein, partial [Solirubrobacteraceae bacterium]
MSEDDVRWRSLGALFVAGGVLTLVSLLLPVDAGSRTLGVFLVGVSAVVSGIATILLAARLPSGDRWLSIYLAFGTLLITFAIAFNNSPASAYALIYLWVGFDAFFFLARRTAFAHLAFVGLSYGVTLALIPNDGQAGAGRWLLLMGTVAVIGTLADLLRTRSEGLIAKLSDAACTDALPGLLNRRGFEARLADELSRARRSGASFSLVVGDLDHFKSVNDRFGHHRGDDALR